MAEHETEQTVPTSAATTGSTADHCYFEIQWLVPAENAIGGKAYWSPLVLSNGMTRTEDRDAAIQDYRTTLANHPPKSIRCVLWLEEDVTASAATDGSAGSREERRQQIKAEWAKAVEAEVNSLDDWPVDRIADLVARLETAEAVIDVAREQGRIKIDDPSRQMSDLETAALLTALHVEAYDRRVH